MYSLQMRVAVLGVIVAAEPHSGHSIRDGSNMLNTQRARDTGAYPTRAISMGWGATGMGIANAGLTSPTQCKCQPASTKRLRS